MKVLKAILLCLSVVFLLTGSVFAFAAEDTAELKVASIDAITYTDNTTGAVQGESGHTAVIGIRFDQAISSKVYNYINGRLTTLGDGFTVQVGAADAAESAAVETNLGQFVNDYIMLNGMTLRQAFSEVEKEMAGLLPEPYLAAHIDPDMQGIRIYFDNRVSFNAGYLHQTVVSGEGDSAIRTPAEGNVITIRQGFKSNFTGVEVKQSVSFAYNTQTKAWESCDTPVYATVDNSHAQNGLKSMLPVNFDTTFTQQIAANHTLDFINQNILIDDMPMNDYGAAHGTDIRVNQVVPTEASPYYSFNIWQFEAGTGTQRDFPKGTRILLKKGLQFVGADGATPAPGMALAQNYLFTLDDLWTQTVVPDGLSVLGFGGVETEGDSVKFDINFSIALADGDIAGAEDAAWVKDNIKINAKTIAEWNAGGKVITAAVSGSSLRLTVSDSVFKSDNTDLVEVLDSFATESGVAVEKGYQKYYNATLGSWIDEAITAELNGEIISIASISAFTEQSGNPCFSITFDKPISYKYLPHFNGDISWHRSGATAALGVDSLDILKMEVQPAHEALLKGISINGETIEEIMAKATDGQDRNVVIMVHYNQDLSSMMFSWQAAYTDQVIDYTKDVILEIDSDVFVTPNGGHLDEDVKLTYKHEYSNWYADGEEPTWETTKIEKLDYLLYMQDNDSYAIQVHFRAPASNAEMQNVQDMDFIKNGFKLNGFTMGEIMAGAKDAEGNPVETPVIAHLLPPTGVPGSGKIVVHFFISAKITPETGGVKIGEDGSLNGNVFEVLADTKLPSMQVVDRDYKFVYEGAWAEEVDTSGIEWEEIHLISVSKPVLASEDNVMFTLTFDKDITHKELLHINADVSWLLAVSEQAAPPFRYTAAELNILSAYGILKSLKENILFNGQSIAELMEKETDVTQRPVTVMVHYGQNSAMNQITVAFAGHKTDADGNTLDGANRITDLEQEFTFTIKQGFRTSMLGEIKQDVTFKYNPAAGMFIEEAAGGTLSSNTNVSAVYYNGFKVEKGGTLNVKALTSLDKRLFTVVLEDPTSTFEVIGADSLQEGANTVTLKITSTDGTTAEYTFTVNVTAESEEGGCGSAMYGGTALAGVAIALACAAIMKKSVRRKEGE